jgi:predicted MPP superfamily phosphohydrolase
VGLDPSHHGLRIAQLSDLHIGFGVPVSRIVQAVRRVNELAPDLVVLTGDFVTFRTDPHELPAKLLSMLEAPSVAIPGNHDHWSKLSELKSSLEKRGIPMLQNQHTTFRLKGADFPVVGIDDSTSGNDDVEAAFRGAPASARLVLTHTPRCAKKLPTDRGLLCLSGHTHGGQVDVPSITAGLFKAFGEPWYRGAYDVGGNQLYVSRGLGFGKGTPYPRIHSDPEVTLFRLSCLEGLATRDQPSRSAAPARREG